MSDILRETKHYVMYVNNERTAYEVMNKNTLVVECTTTELPTAHHAALSLDMALEKRHWEWLLAEEAAEYNDATH